MRTAFPLKLDLPDLTHEDMAHLIMKTAKARGYRLEKSVESQLPRIIRDSHTSADARAYNSILAGSVLSKAIQAQAARARRKYPALASKKSSSSLLATLTVGDFTTSQDSSPPVPESAEEVLAELDHVRGDAVCVHQAMPGAASHACMAHRSWGSTPWRTQCANCMHRPSLIGSAGPRGWV